MILCVGLNPVYQKTLTIEGFRINQVNRAQPEIIESSAGKGINVARTIKTLGNKPLVTGFLGGDTGKYIRGFLDEEGLESDFVPVSSATRTCTTILDPRQQTHTEIVEEGKPVSVDDIKNMYRVFADLLPTSRSVTISGTAPQQVPSDIYAHFIRSAKQVNVPVLLDTQKDLLLQSLDAAPFLVKINQDELGAAFQETINSPEILFRLIDRVHERGVECVVISHGKEAIVLSHHGERRRIIPPSIRAINPVGSGDAVLGGIASALFDGKDIVEAVRLGTACGAANALTLWPGHVHLKDVTRFKDNIHVETCS